MGLWLGVMACLFASGVYAQTIPTEDDYYKMITLPIPEGVVLEVGGLAVMPDGRLAVTGSSDSTMRLWDLSTGDEVSKIGPGKGLVACVRFSPDGKLVVVGGGVARIQGRVMEFPDERIRVYKVLDANVPAAEQKQK